HLVVADRARPLECAKDDVVGVARAIAGEKRLALDGAAQRIETGAELRQARIAVADKILQRRAKALFAVAAEILLIGRADVAVDVEEHEADQPRLQHRLGPILDKAGERAAGRAAKQRWPIAVALFEIVGD